VGAPRVHASFAESRCAALQFSSFLAGYRVIFARSQWLGEDLRVDERESIPFAHTIFSLEL
jgi:hypothetical protein